ncbi:hypothetical protein BS47DRAFT_1367137 [Hydnum rufescens UP504]|uniref:Uncharacterized protein n=1 Tax=Hydnum rufescens UP504 TaxID=1448309 RepID=A0A9P6AKZ3_9AGAM|nr:hypothetical protein BS47DRAFT_1367137 [Hydnum rufescens UP504]
MCKEELVSRAFNFLFRKLKAQETENWHDHPICFINIKYTQILANYNAWKSPNSSLHMDNPQDPAELEQDHTPATAGAWSYRPKSIQDPAYMRSPQTHMTTDKTRHHTPAVAGVWCYLGNVSNGNASNKHMTDENVPSEWPWEPHPPQQVWPIYGYIKYHTPAAAGVWYYKILDSNPNEPQPQTCQMNTQRMKIR